MAHLGSTDAACAAVRSGLLLEPGFTIGRFRAGARSDNTVYLRGRERIYEMIGSGASRSFPPVPAKVGLPERKRLLNIVGGNRFSCQAPPGLRVRLVMPHGETFGPAVAQITNSYSQMDLVSQVG